MSKIGTFTKRADGQFDGHIQTLQLDRVLEIRAIESRATTGPGPHYQVVVPGTDCELGIGSLKEKKDGSGHYIDVRLDCPTLETPIYCALVKEKVGDAYALVWDRPKAGSDAAATRTPKKAANF